MHSAIRARPARTVAAAGRGRGAAAIYFRFVGRLLSVRHRGLNMRHAECDLASEKYYSGRRTFVTAERLEISSLRLRAVPPRIANPGCGHDRPGATPLLALQAAAA